MDGTPAIAPGLERYQLLEEVGHGGMSTVWRGHDTTLNREVAVKILHPHLAGEGDARQRFQREAQAVAKLHHPNILQIYDYSGLDSPSSFIVTEFIRGRTLKHFLADRLIELPEIAVAIVAEVARALVHAHSLSIIHRDLKPENVMIREDGVLKLMDFGIAQIVDVTRLTMTGELIGSPAYMAPEQVDGRPLDFRTDVFSLGTLLYQLSTGELPFRGRNPHEVLKRISECQFMDPTLVNPRVDDRLASIIKRALARLPGDRYPDVAAMLVDLEQYLAHADLGDGRDALREFFADPQHYIARVEPSIVSALARHGEAALAKRETALALSLFNRALGRDPKNAHILQLLNRLSKRRRLGRTMAALGVLTLLAGIGTLAVRLLPAPAEPLRVGPDPSPSRILPAPPTKVTTAPLEPTKTKPVVPVGHTLRGDALRPIGPRVREIEIAPVPKSVHMTLDDKPLGYYGGEAGTRIKVGPGAHTLVLTGPKGPDGKEPYQPARISIGANEYVDNKQPNRLSVRLAWKPAIVTVNTNVPTAQIVIAGQVASQGTKIRVPLPAGDKPEASVILTARAPGYEELYTSIKVKAGEVMDAVNLTLHPQ